MANDEKVCNTENINQNIYLGKSINNYCKQFETLLMKDDGNKSTITAAVKPTITPYNENNDFSQFPTTKPQPVAANRIATTNLNLYEDPDVAYQRPNDDLQALESTLSNLESYLDMNPNEASLNSMNSCNITNCPSDDTLSDFDLDRFNSNARKSTHDDERRLTSISSAIRDRIDTTSLSDFHNVRDVLMTIRERLDTCLKTSSSVNGKNDADDAKLKPETSEKEVVNINNNLELNIVDLKRELDRYVQILNEKKENELRKFSENMINQQNIVQMKNAFFRKEHFSKHIYETLTPASNKKFQQRTRYDLPCIQTHVVDDITLRRCYNDTESCCGCSEINSVEYYSMLINEDVEKSLHGAPNSFLQREREKISLVNFRDPINVIRQWQDYQVKTVRVKPKQKKFKLSWRKDVKRKPPVWGFTLDYRQTKILQQKLDRERRIRLVCRMIFYFFSIVCFVLIVVIVQSVFNYNKKRIELN